MIIDIHNGITTRSWEVTLITSEGEFEVVQRMFDISGTETFDPTAAVELELDGEVILLEAGDTLQFELIAD